MRENFEKKIRPFKEIISKYPTLEWIFHEKYFVQIEKQLLELESDPSTYINPVFLAFFRDKEEGARLLEGLNQYLEIVFKRTSSEKIKKHIAGQLRSLNAFDTLIELSVLTGLLVQLPEEDIELFPNTVGDHDVEARVKIDDRWVYLEVSTLDDPKEDRDEVNELLRNGKIFGKFKSVDFKKDSYRIVGKSARKSRQFSPDTPNVLLLVLIGTRVSMHDFLVVEKSLDVKDISNIIEFDRNLKYVSEKTGLSPHILTENEKNKLKSLFTNEKWTPLLKLN